MGWVLQKKKKKKKKKKNHQLLFVAKQNVQDGLRFVGISNKNLKHMEGLKLDVARFFPQHVHHKFEIVWVANIATHGSKVVAVKQQLSKELEGLPTSDIVIRVEK